MGGRKEPSARENHSYSEEKSDKLVAESKKEGSRAVAVNMTGATRNNDIEAAAQSPYDASQEFTPEWIRDQRQKELERSIRSSGMVAEGSTSRIPPVARASSGTSAVPRESIQSASTTNNGATDVEELLDDLTKKPRPTEHRFDDSARASLPGAFRQNGPDFDEAHDDDAVGSEDGHSASNHRRSSVRSVKSRNQSLLKASMVDDAEAIFYAEDAVIDRSRRNMIIAIAMIGAACILVISLTFLLRDDSPETQQEETCPFEGDREICCSIDLTNFSNPGIGPAMCHCLNNTQGVLESANDLQRTVYNMMKMNLIAVGDVDQDYADALDPAGCDPIHQALLFVINFEALGLSLDNLATVPVNVVRQLRAMLVMYIMMGGINWNQNTGWYENVSFCTWFGMGCIFVETISSIRLPQNGLKGQIPTDIGYMQFLRDLDLSGNPGITGSLPSELARLTSLDSLDFSGSRLGGPMPAVISNMTSVNRLDLSASDFSGTLPSDIFQLRAIRFLSLSDNQLYGTLPREVGELRRLDILRLKGNQLTGTLPAEMENMTNLGLLDIRGNNFSGPIPDFLGRMENLNLIDISNSGLTGTIPESFCDLPAATRAGDMNMDEINKMLAQRVTRQIVMNCTNIELCSCCGATGSDKIAIVCFENLPAQILLDEL